MSDRTKPTTGRAVSADGTEIAFETRGHGPALVVVDGAMCYRQMGPSRDLAEHLGSSFTVTVYDRRARGESGPGASAYDLERELEDLAAVIDASGGRAHVLGISSGGHLSLRAAAAGLPIQRLATYEAPMILDDSHPATDPGFADHLQKLVDEGRRGDAVSEFMKLVGAPAPFRALMRVLPAWKRIVPVAHTLPWDVALVVPLSQGRPLPEGEFAGVAQETLSMAGGKSPAYMRNSQAALAAALSHGRLVELPRQTHMVRAKVLAPVLTEFLTA